FLYLLLGALALEREISDLLRPAIEFAQLLLRISLASNGLHRRIADFPGVANIFFREFAHPFVYELPKRFRRGYFSPAIVEEQHRFIVEFRRHVLFRFE